MVINDEIYFILIQLYIYNPNLNIDRLLELLNINILNIDLISLYG